MKAVVVFGGTFNPVHYGHLIVARAVAERFGFDRITLMPVALPPHRHGPKAAAPPVGGPLAAWARHRLAMLRLAVAGDDLFEVSDLELRRPPPSFTYDTLVELRRIHGPRAKLHWIIGADMLEDLPTWRRAKEVVEMATIITPARPPFSACLPAVHLAGSMASLPAISRRLRRFFTAAQTRRLIRLAVPTPLIDISSSDIRRRLADGKSAKYLTPDKVISYIKRHRLYVAGVSPMR